MKYAVWLSSKTCKPILIGQYETLCEAVKVVEQCKQVHENCGLKLPVLEIRDLRGNKI